MIRHVERDGRRFTVHDDPQTAAWNYWQDHFQADWENFTLRAIEKFADAQGVYLDIGAWVGPTVLWAADHFATVVAVEPDPVALQSLYRNLSLNRSAARVVEKAVSDQTGVAHLEAGPSGWGDSQTTILHRRADGAFQVETVTVAGLWDELGFDGSPSLIKMDIECAEALVLPEAADWIEEQECPLILSLHAAWMNDAQRAAVERELCRFDVEVIDDTLWDFRTILCLPR